MNTSFRIYLITIILFSLSLLTWIYLPFFDNGFEFDDMHAIYNNTHIREIKNIPKFFVDPSLSSVLKNNQGYRPVVTTSLAIDYWIAGGLNPNYFHLSMYCIFIIQLGLIFLLFQKLF